MKILLINPSISKSNKNGLDDGLSPVFTDFQLRPYCLPFGIMYIAAVLIENNFSDLMVLDANAESLSLSEAAARAESFRPDIIGITCMTFTYVYTLKLAELLKAKTMAPIVVGGPHVSLYPREVISHECFDLGVIGEGEYVFLRVVEILNNKKTLSADAVKQELETVQGLVYRCGEELIKKSPEVLDDIDALPFPERARAEKNFNNPDKICDPHIDILSMRGCVYNCIFCSHTRWYNRVRRHSPGYVFKEMIHCIERYGIRKFNFYDDVFTVEKERTLELCRLISGCGYNISFSIMTRPDLFDDELARSLKQAGCCSINFGVETGDQDILDGIRKGLDIEKVKEKFIICRNNGINFTVNFMIGFPEETPESIESTRRLIKDLNLDSYKVNILIPYPGSLLYRKLLKEQKIDDFWKEMTLKGETPRVPDICSRFSRADLEKIRSRIELIPYLRLKTYLLNCRKIFIPGFIRYHIKLFSKLILKYAGILPDNRN